uniref:ParB/Sulfiredoxin domain-containing protein n=1 Tax=Spiroplasma citri TaxID=2133 RepID=Q3ZVN8_SPICI|nr:hypothetical protein [Spiroplasma citri]CAI94287.1 hypothetical protein [Spiroplasma citri]
MPIKLNDFMQETYYKVDYEKLLDYFSQFRIFLSKWNNKKYLKNWIDCLKRYDKEISQQINEKITKINVNTNLVKDEWFNQKIDLEGNEIVIHFNINIVNQAIYNLKEQEINLNLFKNEKSNIYWTPILNETIIEKHTIKNSPIYLTKFFNNEQGRITKWLLIDGNHRVSKALALGKQTINCVYITQDEIIKINPFINDFDKYFYILWNEINNLKNYRINNLYISDRKLFKKSFLIHKLSWFNYFI